MWAERVEAYGPPLNELRAHRTNELRASEIARRRTEEKRAEALLPLGTTTTAGDSAMFAPPFWRRR